MTNDERNEFIFNLAVGDKVCSDYVYQEKNLVRNIVEIRVNSKKDKRIFRLDGGKCCSICGRVGTPINGYYDKGISSVHIFPVL